MLQWLKRSLSSALGDKKDVVKNWKLVKYFNEKANRELDGKRQQLLLDNYNEVMKAVYNNKPENLTIWPDFGTLLGYYRDGGVVKHDLDMDFGVLYDDFNDFLEFEKIIIKNNFVKTREIRYNNELVEYSYSFNGLNVDFMFYRRKENYIETETVLYSLNYLGKPVNREVFRYKIPFSELKADSSLGYEVYIPKNTEEYLETVYEKDFRIPTKHYNFRENKIYVKVDESPSEINLFK